MSISSSSEKRPPLSREDFLPITLAPSKFETTYRKAVLSIMALEIGKITQMASFLKKRLYSSHTASVLDITLDPKVQIELRKSADGTDLVTAISEEHYKKSGGGDGPYIPLTEEALVGMANQTMVRHDLYERNGFYERDLHCDYLLVGVDAKRPEAEALDRQLNHVREVGAEASALTTQLATIELAQDDSSVRNDDDDALRQICEEHHIPTKKGKERTAGLAELFRTKQLEFQKLYDSFDEERDRLTPLTFDMVTKMGYDFDSFAVTDRDSKVMWLREYMEESLNRQDWYVLLPHIMSPTSLVISFTYIADAPQHVLCDDFGSINIDTWFEATQNRQADYAAIMKILADDKDRRMDQVSLPKRHPIRFWFVLHGEQGVDDFVSDLFQMHKTMPSAITKAATAYQRKKSPSKLPTSITSQVVSDTPSSLEALIQTGTFGTLPEEDEEEKAEADV